MFLSQLVFSSEPWTVYLQTQIKSLSSKEQQRGDNSSFITVSIPGLKYKNKHLIFIYLTGACESGFVQPILFPVTGQVNEVTMSFSQPGYFLVSVDACSGKVTKKTSFSRMDAKMEQYLKTGIPKRWARKTVMILSTTCAFERLT